MLPTLVDDLDLLLPLDAMGSGDARAQAQSGGFSWQGIPTFFRRCGVMRIAISRCTT